MRKEGDFPTRFQHIAVWKSPLSTEFRVAGAIHASYHEKRFLTGLAWDLLAAAAMLRPSGKPTSILMLGVAGGTALRTLRHLLPEVSLTGIDLDAEILVAGDDVATGSRLAESTVSFADWRDRMFWKRIKVRKLK